MAQHDYSLANQTGLEFRADLNNVLSAIVSGNSGATEPSTTYANMIWVDTSAIPAAIKMRDSTNISWNILGYSDGTLPNTVLGVTVQPYDADTAKTDTAQNFTAPQRSALLTYNDGNFDLAVKQNFKCTTAGAVTLTFSNQVDGLSGSVIFINSSNHTVSAHANTKLTASDLGKLSATGTYRIDYLSDGTNAYCSVVGAYS